MKKKLRKKAVFVCIILILVLAMMYGGLRILESTFLSDGRHQIQTTSKTIIRDGVRYYPRQDITTVLVMGINERGPFTPTAYNSGGAVDMLMLLIFDEKTQTCKTINLNRDMMVDMPTLNKQGKEVGVYYGQLAFSHTYGDGMEDSCVNVCKTVSNLFYGLKIDYYISLNLDAIKVINDSVGGVTVNIVDDFSAVDPLLPMGEVLLKGEQAVTFLQTRWYVTNHLNLSRMERHKEYIQKFVPTLRSCMEENIDFAVNAYESVSDYIVTNCSAQVFSRLASNYEHYSFGEVISIKGDNVLGEDLYEYYPDEEALDALILELFYAPK